MRTHTHLRPSSVLAACSCESDVPGRCQRELILLLVSELLGLGQAGTSSGIFDCSVFTWLPTEVVAPVSLTVAHVLCVCSNYRAFIVAALRIHAAFGAQNQT